MIQEFKDFINRGNLIDLAIAVVLATFFAPIVSAVVDGVVMNLIAAIFGKPNFDSIRLKIRDGDPGAGVDAEGVLIDPPTYLEFGTVITAIVTFVIVAFVCFLIVKAYNKMQKAQEEEEAGPSEVDLLTEIRDQLRARG